MAENSLVDQLNDNIQYLETLIEVQKNQPYFYFKVKLIVNRNNSFELVDKVIGLGKSNLYIFWTEEDQGGKYQALNNAKKQPIDFSLFQYPQQKVPLSKFEEFTLIANNDPQFIPYIKSVVPSFSPQKYPEITKTYSLLFMKSLQQYETHCILCSSYTLGMQLLYSLQLIKSLKQYEETIQKNSNSNRSSFLLNKSNLKLMRMICNLKFGYLDANTDNFGYNYPLQYGDMQERAQMTIYQKSLTKILNCNDSFQFGSSFCVRLLFKIIDDMSRDYAVKFLLPVRDRAQNISVEGCELIQEMFESLINHLQQQSLKQLNKNVPNITAFPNLKYLNLSSNKLTDNIFSNLHRLIYPDTDKKSSKNIPSLSSSQSILPLFPSLTTLDLSKNYISLSFLETHKSFIRVLQNLSTFVLKINLSNNMIKSLQFFEKYFLKTDAKAGSINLNIPVEYFDLSQNTSIKQEKKDSFINSYIQRMEQLQEKCITDIGFIIDLGKLIHTGNPNIIKYLIKLRKYYDDQQIQTEFQDKSQFYKHFQSLEKKFDPNFEIHQNNYNSDCMAFAISRPQTLTTNAQLSNQAGSSILNDKQASRQSSISTSPILYRTSTQSRQQLLNTFAKLFYLKDYKQLQIYKNQLQQQHQVSQLTLLSTFAKQWEEKKIEQKRILQLFQQVINFIDGKGQGIKNQSEEKLINDKLDRLVGIIRRKGLEGQAAQSCVYLKYLRDQIILEYLQSQQGFNRINPIYQTQKKVKSNYPAVYYQAIQQVSSFTQIDYKELSVISGAILQKKFFENKASPKMEQSTYDRLRYLLVQRKLTQEEVIHMADNLLKQLRLFPCRAVRLYDKTIRNKNSSKPLMRAKQKLTSTTFLHHQLQINKMQYIRQYSIAHYPFNSSIKAQTDLTGFEGIMSCLSFPQHLLQQALSFIQIINNFVTFLYYTPQSISEQTVTYINYIISYLNQLPLQNFQDLEWKEFLIEELYVHLMAFKPQHKLVKGLLLNVIEYLTSRVICRGQLQKYILAFVLQNQSASIQETHIILNSLDKSSTNNSPSAVLLQRQTKISWTIPNHFLQTSFLNQGKLTIFLKVDTSSLVGSSQQQQIEVFCHETMTIAELVSYLLNEYNGYVGRLPLERKLKRVLEKSEEQELQKYWIFEKKNKSNKLQYFKPFESYRYIGQIVSEMFQNDNNITLYFRKSVMTHHYHNKNYLSYELNEIELFSFFNKIVSNIQMSIDLISKLPQQMTQLCYYSLLLSPKSGQYSTGQFVNIAFAHIICIYYCHQLLSLTQPKTPSVHLTEDDIEQGKEQLLHSLVELFLTAKPNKYNEKIIVNCKTFTIEDRLWILTKTKELIQHQQSSKTTLSDQILAFVHSLSDLAFCQTLISDHQIIVINNRFIIVGKLLEHTNQLNEIVNIHSKLQYVVFFNEMTDLRLQISENSKKNVPSLQIQKLHFDDINKKLEVINHQIKGESYFVLCLYNLIISVCKNIINFETKLLYQIQSTGLGTGAQKRNSQKLQFYHNEKENSTSVQGLFSLPETFVAYNIIRNKQNQNYQKLSQSHSKPSLANVQSNNLIKNENNRVNAKKPEQVQQSNEVYSRKSSKRSLKSNQSQKSVRRQNSRKQLNNQNNRNQDSESLIPSRKSAYNQDQNQMSQNQSSFQKPSDYPHDAEINTDDIINKLTQQSKLQERISRSQEVLKPQISQPDQVVTNQQRKSRKQIPKRRSTRQKDR